jgi:uncharacterized protein (DUF305 family)
VTHTGDAPPDAISPSGGDGGTHAAAGETRRSATWSRPLLVVGGALALLLLGAAAGMLITLPGSRGLDVPGPDSVDVGFAQDMSVHHEQAVRMANWERDHTTDPQLRQLAFDIESTQNRQIGYLQGWLGLWGAASQSPNGYMRWMSDSDSSDGMAGHQREPAGAGVDRMPGMATDEELHQLTTSTGEPMDVLFLRLMLRHHEGGVDMLRYAATHAEHEVVRNLANQTLTAQTSESEYMRQLLAARGATPLPPG